MNTSHSIKLNNFSIDSFQKNELNKSAGYIINFDFEYNGLKDISSVISYADDSRNNKMWGFNEKTLDRNHIMNKFIDNFNRIENGTYELDSLNKKNGISNPALYLIFHKIKEFGEQK